MCFLPARRPLHFANPMLANERSNPSPTHEDIDVFIDQDGSEEDSNEGFNAGDYPYGCGKDA